MIELNNVCKRYNEKEVLRDISCVIDGTGVIGLVGSHGAGKSALLKILAGYHFQSSGDVFIYRRSSIERNSEIKSLTGFMPEAVSLYPDLSAGEYLSFIADSHSFNRAEKQERIEQVSSRFGLRKRLEKPIKALSAGLSRLLCLAQAVIHDPPILLLDNPTAGIDPTCKKKMWDYVREIRERKIVIISTHSLYEIEQLCGRILRLEKGRLIRDGSVDDIFKNRGNLQGGEFEAWFEQLKREAEQRYG